jgi:hypothetical protein
MGVTKAETMNERTTLVHNEPLSLVELQALCDKNNYQFHTFDEYQRKSFLASVAKYVQDGPDMNTATTSCKLLISLVDNTVGVHSNALLDNTKITSKDVLNIIFPILGNADDIKKLIVKGNEHSISFINLMKHGFNKNAEFIGYVKKLISSNNLW